MKPLSKRATAALAVLRAGGHFESDPTYGGTFVTLRDDTGATVDGFGRRGYAKAALRELVTAGYEIDEEMDGRNIIVGRLQIA
jgi:hypothetical protein